MRITCDQCSTKYSIADDKVRGKMFKIRCKKCQHVIVVRNEGEGASAEPAVAGDGGVFDNKETRVYNNNAAYAKAAGAESDESAEEADRAVWHVVVSGDQVGPLTIEQLQAKIGSGEVGASSYVWRDGFGDWTELRQVPELAALLASAAAPEVSSRAPSGRITAPVQQMQQQEDQRHEPDLFSAPVASKPPVTRSAPRASEAESSLFSAERTTREAPSEDMFAQRGGAVSAAPSGPSLTGQRSENSVLFSLNNLTGAPMNGGGDASRAPSASGSTPPRTGTNEGSGLIDIRAMAQNTLASVGVQPQAQSSPTHGEELPMFGSNGMFSPAPVLLPTVQPGMPSWVKGVMAAGGVLLVVLAVMVIMMFSREKAPQVAPYPGVGAPAVTEQGPGGKTPTVKERVPAGDRPGATAKGSEEEAPGPGGDSKTGDEGEKAKPTPKVASSSRTKPKERAEVQDTPPQREAAPAPKAAKPARGRDELDDLLSKAIGGGNVAAPAPAAPREEAAPKAAPKPADEDLPDTLSPRDIQGGMSKVKSKVSSCYSQYNVPGTVFLEVTIGSSGRVQNASPTGKFAGTPTGDCVARAAKSASFPPFKGGAISIQYPFMLSK